MPVLLEEVKDYKDIFISPNIVDTRRPKGIEYTIDLEPRSYLLFRLLYNLSLRELEVL